jgi:hypothetical protein
MSHLLTPVAWDGDQRTPQYVTKHLNIAERQM